MYVQRNAALEIRRQIRAHFRSIPVLSHVPDNAPDAGVFVTVADNGTSTNTRLWARENIRVVAYSDVEIDSRNLAALLDAWLLDPANVAGYQILPGAGLVTAWDEKLGLWITAVTVAAITTKRGIS
ncbi:hypothetical protein [Corynebacterium heidelbergense]|uniref:Phage tail protein n=1 Tax=Corynebacterium heidelbergense TaxID=2055947 RepID=A0A364VE34_9CORY|nr:hypothetical protein [Corynebacterium heidelbergense]RAV34922.1 hypothetical protein CWC39_00870 [Corynebacterium heidelbergense]WCZ36061.1 hypothetical protein CHEID_02475 [Corynebacterium heidelbergense]